MGQTITQKIIARAAGRPVEPGEYVTVTPDYCVGHEMFWPLHQRHMKEIGVERFRRPEKVILVVDHTGHADLNSPYVKTHSELRDWVRRTGFENFYDVGRGGLRHLVMVEKGYARPGLFVFSDEGNIAAIGAFGALNMPTSWEVIVPMIGDENWVLVPDSARIVLRGALPFGVLVRDLVQAINRDFGNTDRMLQKSLEFDGPAIEGLSLDARQALLAGMYHCGADTAIMRVDRAALDYVEARAHGRPYHVLQADADATYAWTTEYDLAALAPLVTVPPEQNDAVPVGDVAGTRVNHATIGSCAGCRLDDLRAAATLLRGRRLAPGVTMYVTPGSPEIYAAAAREGLLATFAEAGAAVLLPGCGTCFGYVGAMGADTVAISTHQHNYHGRSGSADARIYLGSPYVVAASAIAGAIVDPRQLLAERPS